ncbi:MAG: hypothetical protein Q8922_04485 [Bacteroidota bacterium]|nr:hypothetical protein [Bacteroidota bacterium]MDP4231838.1 hypothetical protein [Bacteroidota bacterium]MDP4242724.1 hypothetical protein [Bacteroidota bacterium]MDP4287175.1 hypothetical protein [Bacteroidota bacterium]
MMKSTLIALLLLVLMREAKAQSVDTLLPQSSKAKPTVPDLHLDDWKKANGWPIPPKPGITLYFDYTKFFEWLLPKKHPTIPPDCDPNNIHDSIPQLPKKDSVRLKEPPV